MAVFAWCTYCSVRGDQCASHNSHKAQGLIKWKVNVQIGGRAGKRKQKTFTSQADAAAQEKQWVVDFQRKGLYPVSYKETRTFGEACEHYLNTYAIPNNQFESKYQVEYFKSFFGSQTPLIKIDNERCKELYAQMLAEKRKDKDGKDTDRPRLSLASVIREWTVIQGIFRENSKYVEGNPAKGVIPTHAQKKADRQRTSYFTNEQYAKLIECNPDESDRDLLVLFRNTGMRKSEGKNLRFEHCDFTTETIHILDQKNGEQGSIPMVPEVKARLLEIIRRTNRTNGPVLDFVNFRRRMVKILKNAGLLQTGPDALTLHSLRHSWGTYIQKNYKDLNVTMKLMRHKSIKMTQRYSHAADELKRAAALAGSVSLPTKQSTGDELLSEIKGKEGG